MNRSITPLTCFYFTILLIWGVGVVIADQFIKYKIRNFGGFYICNKGIAFGLALSPGVFWLILSIFLVIIFIYFKYLLNNSLSKPLFFLVFVLILAGAVSNIIDRLLFGCVIDYIFTPYKYLPVFNVADIAIFVGGLLLFYVIYNKNRFKRA